MLKLLFITLFLFISWATFAQKNYRFKDEVQELSERYPSLEIQDSATVFTGSSSIRMWHQLSQEFPNQHIINTGFGGSEASDLLMYQQELVVRFQPKKVFIYEGDNDIARGKSVRRTYRNIKKLLRQLRRKLPNTEFVLISAKPSLVRWHLKEKYEALNKALDKFAKRKRNIAFIDVWSVMLDNENNPKKELFLEDGLHMNPDGYALWKPIIAEAL